MSTITFDTDELVSKLQQAGFDERQAEAVVRVVATAQVELVTRDYLDLKLEREFAPVRSELLVIKWMMGALIAIAVANFAKQFF